MKNRGRNGRWIKQANALKTEAIRLAKEGKNASEIIRFFENKQIKCPKRRMIQLWLNESGLNQKAGRPEIIRPGPGSWSASPPLKTAKEYPEVIRPLSKEEWLLLYNMKWKDKVNRTNTKIIEVFNRAKRPYIAFSGGKDSTALLHRIYEICQVFDYRIDCVYSNTGLEYPEIRQFISECKERYKDRVTFHQTNPMGG